MGLAGILCSSGFPSEAKCEGDGVRWYDGKWAHKVIHATQTPNPNFQVNQILEKKVKLFT